MIKCSKRDCPKRDKDVVYSRSPYYKMNLSSTSLETIKSEDQINYRLNGIGKIKDYFKEEIQYQQSLTSKLRKYLTFLDYTNKILTVVYLLLINNSIKNGIIDYEKFLEIIKDKNIMIVKKMKIKLRLFNFPFFIW